VHVGHDRRIYNRRHVPGAVHADLHTTLALRGTAPETGTIERASLVPTREQFEVTLRRYSSEVYFGNMTPQDAAAGFTQEVEAMLG